MKTKIILLFYLYKGNRKKREKESEEGISVPNKSVINKNIRHWFDCERKILDLEWNVILIEIFAPFFALLAVQARIFDFSFFSETQ